MEKELSKELTIIYENNSSDVNEAIDNLEEGSVVIIMDGDVDVYSSFCNAEERLKCLHKKGSISIDRLLEDGIVNTDEIHIRIV